MQGRCASCGRMSHGQLLCPQCGNQLVGDTTIPTVPLAMSAIDDGPDGPSFIRRLALGVVVMFGVFHGLKHFTLAIGLWVADSAVITPEGVFGLLVAATLAAAVIAGTVNRWAELAGLVLGLGAAGVSIVLQTASGQLPPEEWHIGASILLAIVGVIGGLAGRLMVPPAPKLPRFGQIDARVLAKVKSPPIEIIWWRIAFGVLLAVVASLYADSIRQMLSRALAGHAGSYGTSPMLTWQVSVLGVLLGGVVAGANTRNGLRQGVITGFLVAAGAVIVEMRRGNDGSRLLEFWANLMNLETIGPSAYALLGASAFLISAMGGWLGAHLLPPRSRR